jgi:hypothetical protein
MPPTESAKAGSLQDAGGGALVGQPVVYWTRYYVLAMYCAFSFMQSMCWGIMGPISTQVRAGRVRWWWWWEEGGGARVRRSCVHEKRTLPFPVDCARLWTPRGWCSITDLVLIAVVVRRQRRPTTSPPTRCR